MEECVEDGENREDEEKATHLGNQHPDITGYCNSKIQIMR